MSVFVIDPGAFTTVQDEGRWGYQAAGMPVAGAMDRYAHAVANLLCGNPRGLAVLEMTLKGGTFRFTEDRHSAIAGADMGASLDGEPIPNWSCFRARAGSIVHFDFAREGCRAYLAIEGGFDLPMVFGSRSTHTRSRLGGLEGRALRSGDRIEWGAAQGPATPRRLFAQFAPRHGDELVVRVLPGPQDDLFVDEAIALFFSAIYEVTNEADRMGYRLEGPALAHRGRADIVSDAIAPGSIQVPAHGRPIVMLSDRQTTGGYAKIGTVIGPDLRLFAQAKAKDRIRFARVGDEEAVAVLRDERARLDLVEAILREES